MINIILLFKVRDLGDSLKISTAVRTKIFLPKTSYGFTSFTVFKLPS